MSEENKGRKKRWIKYTISFVIALIFIIGTTSSYLLFKSSNLASETYSGLNRGDKSDLREEPVDVGKDNFSLLILGDDARPGENFARTDAMLLATFNKKERSILFTSIPRDSYVEIAGKGNMDKINHANAFGGIDMAVNTVENFLDIPIDYYAIAKFQGLIDVIDALGGIEIDVVYTFDFTEGGETLHFEEGPSLLNGEEALAYSRERKSPNSGGDLGRGQRQQQVLEGIFHKAASFSSIQNFNELFNSLGENLKTDLTFGNMLSLHQYASSISSLDKQQLQGEPFRGKDGISYLRIDESSLNDIKHSLAKHLEFD